MKTLKQILDEANRCWSGYEPVPGKEPYSDDSCQKIDEKSPPGKKYEEWIRKNKQRFIDQYGEKKGLEILYAKAWKMKNDGTYD